MFKPTKWKDEILDTTLTTESATGTGSKVNFSITAKPPFVAKVTVAGVRVYDWIYNSATNILSFDTAPANGAAIVCFYYPEVQAGTNQSAANFNNMEAGIMEANALAAMNAAYRRYEADEALNREIIAIDATLTGTSEQSVDIPAEATRRRPDYNVGIEIKSVTGGTAGDVIITTKQANGVKLKYNGTASSIAIRCKVSGGMI